MPEKPDRASEYNSEQAGLVRATCLYVATKLGDLMDELVVVGVLVPSLIDPSELPEGTSAHVGTMDLDIGLELGLLNEGRYHSLTERLRGAGFEPDRNDEGRPTDEMGCHLLTETMSYRHQLGMASYDRLFPNQDTMPAGGFGNLIALPLQQNPRKEGNTVFVDDNFDAYADQWAYLASLPRLSPETVHAIAEEATRTDRVIGVPLPISADEDESKPWTRPPSRKSVAIPIEGPLPAEVRAVLSRRLFVEKMGLPSLLINRSTSPCRGDAGTTSPTCSPDTASLWRSKTSGTKGNRSIFDSRDG